jgi:hypothetical protein
MDLVGDDRDLDTAVRNYRVGECWDAVCAHARGECEQPRLQLRVLLGESEPPLGARWRHARWAAWTAGERLSIPENRPLRSGSGKLGTPFSRIQAAYAAGLGSLEPLCESAPLVVVLVVPTWATPSPEEPLQPAATSVRPTRAAAATTVAADRTPNLRPCLSRGWGRRLVRRYASSFTEASAEKGGVCPVSRGLQHRRRVGLLSACLDAPASLTSCERITKSDESRRPGPNGGRFELEVL